MPTKLWVFVEQFKSVIAQSSLEALGEARRLNGEMGGAGVTALLFGQGVADLAGEVIAHGADEVLLADDATLAEFRSEPYTALLVKLAQEYRPEVILAGATTRGRDLLGMAAVDLNCGAIADAIALTYTDGKVQATRPVYAGKLLATVMADDRRPQLISLRPRAFPKPEPDPARTGVVTPAAPVLAEDAIPLKVLDYVVEQGQVSLADAANWRRRWARLDSICASGRANRQDCLARSLHRLRHLRRDPAPGRDALVQDHRRHQQGRRGAYLQTRALRRGGRSVQDRPCAHSRVQEAPGEVGSTDGTD